MKNKTRNKCWFIGTCCALILKSDSYHKWFFYWLQESQHGFTKWNRLIESKARSTHTCPNKKGGAAAAAVYIDDHVYDSGCIRSLCAVTEHIENDQQQLTILVQRQRSGGGSISIKGSKWPRRRGEVMMKPPLSWKTITENNTQQQAEEVWSLLYIK